MRGSVSVQMGGAQKVAVEHVCAWEGSSNETAEVIQASLHTPISPSSPPERSSSSLAPTQQSLAWHAPRRDPPHYFEKCLGGWARSASGAPSFPSRDTKAKYIWTDPLTPSNREEQGGMLTLPLTVSRDRVTGGRWSDFSSICQPITVMLPTRSLSADLQ